jgi:hypothetical protein
VIPPEHNAQEFVWRMEEILDLYERSPTIRKDQ